MLLSPFLSSCEKLMLALPLVDAPALPTSLEPELPLAPAPVALEGEDEELLSDGDEAELLLEDGDELDGDEVEEELPAAPAPVALLPLLSLAPDSANAPNEAREADIAKVKMSFLFMRISCTVEH